MLATAVAITFRSHLGALDRRLNILRTCRCDATCGWVNHGTRVEISEPTALKLRAAFERPPSPGNCNPPEGQLLPACTLYAYE